MTEQIFRCPYCAQKHSSSADKCPVTGRTLVGLRPIDEPATDPKIVNNDGVRDLIGKTIGDNIEVTTPRGSKVYEITGVAFG